MKAVILDPRSSDPTWGGDEAVMVDLPDDFDGDNIAGCGTNEIRIAALPDLLSAAESALETLEWHVSQDAAISDEKEEDVPGHSDILALRAAIAKAKVKAKGGAE